MLASGIMGTITAVAILILYAGSLPATVDYVQFMKVEKTAYIKIPFNWLYSIYIAFAVAVIGRYGDEHHELAGRAKDMGSAAVFVLMLNVLLVWGAILLPRLP